MSYNLAIAEQHRRVLELTPPFSGVELKEAYRRLIKQWHPDLYEISSPGHIEATEKAKLINVAYEYLSEYMEVHGGDYKSPATDSPKTSWAWADLQPKRRYEGKTYTPGFPDPLVTEIFLKSSHIVSTAYNRTNQTLYIKFSRNEIYRYFGVPEHVFDAFIDAPSHGRYGHQNIYSQYRYERC